MTSTTTTLSSKTGRITQSMRTQRPQQRQRRLPYKYPLLVILATFACQSPSSLGTHGFAAVRHQRLSRSELFAEGSAGSGDGGAPTAPLFEFDTNAYELKNAARKKFGLEPLTVDQFLDVQAQIQELAMQQQQIQQQQRREAASAQQQSMQQQPTKKTNLFKNLFGNVLEDTCESNFDCQRPQVCCDFGVTKKCCSSGSRVPSQQQMASVPVPVDMRDAYGNPPQ